MFRFLFGTVGNQSLAAIRFARFFSFRFRARPRTFSGGSEHFAKPRIEISTSFSSRAPCEPSKATRRLRTNRIAARPSVVRALVRNQTEKMSVNSQIFQSTRARPKKIQKCFEIPLFEGAGKKFSARFFWVLLKVGCWMLDFRPNGPHFGLKANIQHPTYRWTLEGLS